MKKIALTLGFTALMLINNGCSSTWEGVKSDSSKAWDSTKKAIHEATE